MSELASQGEIVSDKDALKTQSVVTLWLEKIKRQWDDKREKAWRDVAGTAIALYEDGDDAEDVAGLGLTTTSAANLYHSNIETLEPAVYNSTPTPDARPRGNAEDPIARKACDLLEAVLAFNVDSQPFDDVMSMCVKSALVPGRGSARIRYEPTLYQDLDVDGNVFDTIGDERVRVEPVAYDRVVYGPCRQWPPPWIAYKHDLTKDEIEKLVGGKKSKLANLKFGDAEDLRSDDAKLIETFKGLFKTIPTWEIWDRIGGKILFITEQDKDHPLAIHDDPFKFPDFFAEPKPLQQLTRMSGITPICSYSIYKPLLEEFDKINHRIRRLVDQLRVRGLHDPVMTGDFEQLRTCEDGQYIAAGGDAGEMFQKGAGTKLEDLIAHWPLEPTVIALKQLYEQRDALKQLIYEVTGLSDIMRGSSDARETAEAQKIKATWGSQRVQRLQTEVARFARDLFRMQAHIIATMFQEQTLKDQSGIDYAADMMAEAQKTLAAGPTGPSGGSDGQQTGASPQQPNSAPGQSPPSPVGPVGANAPQIDPNQVQQHAQALEAQVIQLLKSKTSMYRIDIEADSTIKNDLQKNIDMMNQFLGFTGQYVQAMAQAAPVMPKMLPAFTTVYAEFARRFKFGRMGQEAIDSMTDLAKEQVEAGIPGQDSNDQKAAQQQAEQQAQQAAAAQQQAQQQHDAQLQADKQAHEKDMLAKTQAHEHAKMQHEVMLADRDQHKDLADQNHDQTLAQISASQAQAQTLHDTQQANTQREHEAVQTANEQDHDRLLVWHEHTMARLDAHTGSAEQAHEMRITHMQHLGEKLKAMVAVNKAAADLKKSADALKSVKAPLKGKAA